MNDREISTSTKDARGGAELGKRDQADEVKLARDKAKLEAEGNAAPSDAAARGPDCEAESKARATHLGKALLTAELTDLIGPLWSAGYRELSGLGGDEKGVIGATKAAHPKVKDGEVQRVLQLWRDATAKRTPTDIPKLPVGTMVDLSQTSATVSDIEFKLPTQMSTNRLDKDFKSAAQLSQEEWMIIAKRTRMMYGLDLNVAYGSSADNDAIADECALTWKVPSTDDYLAAQATGEVQSTLSYTSMIANLVHNRIVDGSASISTPFVSGAASSDRREKQASSRQTKRLFMTGLWRYKQAELSLEHCTELAPRFIAAIDDALKQPLDAQFTALRKVFKRFGHVIPKHVAMGGQLYFQSDRVASGSVDESQVVNTVKAAVNAKYEGVTASVSAGFSDGQGKTVNAQSISESVSFFGVGGDITMVSKPTDWAGTCKDPNQWAIIARSALVPLMDRLDSARHRSISDVWRDGRSKAWGKVPPADYVLPDMDGKPFTIATATATPQLLTPAPLAQQLCPFSPIGQLANAVARGVTWQLVYTGTTALGSGRGLPIYWILEYQDEGLLDERTKAIRAVEAKNIAIFKATGDRGKYLPPTERVALAALKLDNRFFAGSIEAKEAQAQPPETSRATWTLTPADPGGTSAAASVIDQYVVTNVTTGLQLAGVELRSGWGDGEAKSVTSLEQAVSTAGDASPPTWLLRTQEPRTPSH